jgi:CMP-N-acetylneuraminic acid synthetase
MFAGLSVLAVIPARGGSKGIPKKNIAPLAGKPLICYTTKLMSELPWVDKTVVSTDSPEIAQVALRQPGIEIIWRPESLSGDAIGDRDVLHHALIEAEAASHQTFDVVLMVQPTSPLRTAENITQCITTLVEGEWDAVWTVSPTDLSYHPRKQLSIDPDGQLGFFIPGGETVIARQELNPVFHRNGVCYALRRELLSGAKGIWSPGKTTAVVIPGHHISIDTPEDLLAVEALITSGNQ